MYVANRKEMGKKRKKIGIIKENVLCWVGVSERKRVCSLSNTCI